MDIGTLTQLIGSLGFPIACSIALFIQLNKANEQHLIEMEKLSEAINNNTKVLIELKTELGRGEK